MADGNAAAEAEAQGQPLRSSLRRIFSRSRAPLDPGARYALSRRVFLRALGLCYLCAFASFRLQVDGLCGSRGIWPVDEHHLGGGGFGFFALVSSLCGSTDGALHAIAGGGVALSLLLAAGLFPLPILALLWLGYAALTVAGGPFMGYQWESLLLETGLLAALLSLDRPLAPLWRSDGDGDIDGDPPRLSRLLLKWLLCRLMMLSGLVKLGSGDPTWQDYSALDFHYYTQPLPSWPAYYAHHFAAAHRLSTEIMLAIEILVPPFLFAPRPFRRAAAALLVLLQLAIAATGNYGFFNLLTVALCLLTLDDAALTALVPSRLRRPKTPISPSLPSSFSSLPLRGKLRRVAAVAVRVALVPVAAVVFSVSGLQMAQRLHFTVPLPAPLEALWSQHHGGDRLQALSDELAPLRSINSYGLFAVMTTERREIVVEGSDDGERWRAYPFAWKPGALDEAPRQVAPHMPRLDWQMWFAALGNFRRNPWYLAFLTRLLEGEPSVLRLLRDDPFHGRPPRYLRSTLYRYRYSTPEEKAARGEWWQREPIGPYAPTVMLRDGHLVEADL